MVKSELIERSPLRIFEKSIHGGLGAGNIGVLVSRKGVGKTACLVHIATDKLFQNQHVIHVSFASRVDHIISWYEDIFREIARKRNLDGLNDLHDEIVRNRVIMNFNQHGVDMQKVLSSVTAMIRDGNFEADTVIFDGFHLTASAEDDFAAIREFARNSGFEVWFSLSVGDHEEIDGRGVPTVLASVIDHVAVLISLDFVGDHVHFKALKDHTVDEPHDMHLMLDPKTLLIAEES